MAERLTGKRRIDSADVQGAGSYVILRALTVAEARDIIQRGTNETVSIPMSELAARVLEWDWVDERGAALPFPTTDPAVMDRLTQEEVRFLVSALFSGRNEGEIKNSKSD